MPPSPSIQLPGARAHGRLALAVLVSGAAHLLWLGLVETTSVPLPRFPGHDDVPPQAAAEPQPDPAPAAPTDARPPGRMDMLAAATRDAAVIARELNHAPGAPQRFRSRGQDEIDRRFDAAHAAGGSWFRSARIEDITTAADGNARVYRIVTPVGAFCRTYPANGSAPMNTTCPR